MKVVYLNTRSDGACLDQRLDVGKARGERVDVPFLELDFFAVGSRLSGNQLLEIADCVLRRALDSY